jgi:hypothetical protein
MTNQLDNIKNIKRKHENKWLALPDVVGVGIGKTSSGETGIIVSVKELSERVQRKIPAKVESIAVEIRVTGEIRAF